MEFKDQKPIYLQIAEHICDEIIKHTYPEDERLPSVREYATLVEVNVNTLVRSYDWLSQREIIYNKRGMGYFVSSGAEEKIREMRKQVFFEEQLPEIVRTMNTLGIEKQEVIRIIQEISKQ